MLITFSEEGYERRGLKEDKRNAQYEEERGDTVTKDRRNAIIQVRAGNVLHALIPLGNQVIGLTPKKERGISKIDTTMGAQEILIRGEELLNGHSQGGDEPKKLNSWGKRRKRRSGGKSKEK